MKNDKCVFMVLDDIVLSQYLKHQSDYDAVVRSKVEHALEFASKLSDQDRARFLMLVEYLVLTAFYDDMDRVWHLSRGLFMNEFGQMEPYECSTCQAGVKERLERCGKHPLEI